MNSNLEINRTKELAINDEAKPVRNVEKSGEEIYIPDECGDTMWDAVLAQQDKVKAFENTDKTPGE